MEFPTVAARNTSGESSGTTSHTVSLPSGITNGSLVVVLFGLGDGTAPQVSWPEGWQNEIKDAVDAQNYVTAAVAWRECDGEEGSTITVTTTNSAQSAHVALRIEGHDASADPPEISLGNSGDGQLQSPDSLSPIAGAADYLWIAMTVCDGSGSTGPWTVTSAPTNYTDLQNSESGGSTDGVTVGSAERELNASSEDPGDFTVGDSGGKEYIAFTIAVYPTTGPSIPVVMNHRQQQGMS